MKNMDKSWRKSIFKRLIFSFICILLPIYILSIVIYNWGIKTLREEISNSMITQVSFYLDGLEKEVQRIRTLQYDCVSDDNLNQLAAIPESLNDIERMQSILSLQQRLTAVKNSSVYINDVAALIPAVDRKISAIAVSTFDRAEYSKAKYIALSPDAQLMSMDDRMFLCVAYPFLSLNSKKEPIFIITVELSKAKIEEALRGMISNSEEGIVFINPVVKAMIATKYDDVFNNEIQGFIQTHSTTVTKSAKTFAVGEKRYLAVYTDSKYLGAVLCKYVPEDSVFQSLRKYQGWFLLLTFVALVIIIIYSLYMYQFIHKPLSRLAKSFKRVENGDFGIHIEHQHDDEFRYIYTRFNAMVENLNALIDQVYKQRILAQKSELKQLQSQINPHFLYNSFFILNTMSRIGDNENLERFTEQLGEYFRFITRNAADEVPLAKEVNHARVYTEIQAMRFSNRIRVEFEDLPEEYANRMVPRLILQPIIENAFEHGLEKKMANGVLVVKFLKKQDEFHMIIEDNGDGIDDEKLASLQSTLDRNDGSMEITGMMNIHQRVRLKFGLQSGLQITRSELGGLRVTVSIRFTEGGL